MYKSAYVKLFLQKKILDFQIFLENSFVFRENWPFFVGIFPLARSFFNISQKINGFLLEGIYALVLRYTTYGFMRKFAHQKNCIVLRSTPI